MDQRLVDEVAGLNVGEQQDVRMACSRAVLGTLVVGSLGINGNVHRKGTVNDTAGDLALGVHLAQLVGIDGAGHLRVDDLNSGQGRNLGALDAAGMGNGDGVLDDMYLILQRRVGHEGDVGQEQQLLNALDLKHSHMRQRIAGAQTDFLVQHALEEGLGVQQALHVHVGNAVVGQLDGLEGGLHLVRLVDDLIVGEVDVQLGCDLADGSLIADQNGVGNALLVGGVDSLQNSVILGGALLVDLLGVGQDVAAVLLQSGGGLHDLVLHAQDSGGALGIQLLRILAGQNLNTGGAKQSAACKQTNLCPIHSSNPLYCNMLAMVYKMCPVGRTYKVYT